MADIIQINENSWRIEDGMVRFFVLEGEEKALLIDSGMTTQDAIDIAKTITQKPLEMMNTHADRDHVAGNGAFSWCYMNPAEEGNFRAAGGASEIRPVKEGDVIDLGKRPLEIIDIPGHTPGSIAILDGNARVLISGDSVQAGTIFMFGEKRSLTDYVPSMEKLLGYVERFDEIWPSHGPFPVEPSIIAKLIGGANEIMAGTAQGKPVDMFGNKVTLYQFEYAGFFGEPRG
ncbi:MAG: MBL fold metallo-hydrolase [Lachnospiraceae bacterium]|nr:MBL fold metallo-hydrolase [Lachnospiraceae bacterium]